MSLTLDRPASPTAAILIVEDERIVALNLQGKLQKMGYRVPATAASGEDAIRLTEVHRPDLVLMDIHLEGAMDGVEAARILRDRFQTAVVYLTAYSNQEIVARAKVTEPFGYILKPFSERELEVVIEMALYRKQMEQRLEYLEEQFRQAKKLEAIGRLAGGIAHDFNNLLTIINGYTSIVQSSLSAHDRNCEMLAEVLKAGDRAAALTAQLLAYSRKQLLQPRIIDLNELLAGTEKMLRRIIGEDIDLHLAPAQGLHRVKVDPAQMEQVVMNLCVNSRDAMPRGGRLDIETGNLTLADPGRGELQPGAHVVLTVRDTGCGMDQDVLGHLFEPFFTTKEQGKGTGLGLAMVYGTVKQSGGQVEVESQPGRGTVFRILLPAVLPTPAEPTRPAFAGLPRGSETVLLVEDEEAVRKLTAHLLTQIGYTVLVAAGGEQALQIVANHRGPLHLLMSDVVMPRMSGRQVAEAVKVVHPAVKVLFQSGYTDDALLRHGIEASEQDLILKPFTLTDLARRVREVLDRAAAKLQAPG
jgi:signal transduction histidine kinase